MSYHQKIATETSRASTQLANSSFIKKSFDGREKEAAEVGTTFIRSKLREEAWCRKIIRPETLREDQLHPSLHTDLPRKIIELEPDSIATYVPFRGSGRRTWFRGRKAQVLFGKIESDHFKKSKWELMTYETDIRKVLTDNSVKDMADQEDIRFYETMDAIITAYPLQAVNAIGGLNSANVVSGMQNLISRKMPVGVILCTEELYMDTLKLPATSIGDIVAQRHFDEGLTGKTLWGIPVITTIKNDIIPSNEMWICSPDDWLGKFYLLQDATLFIESRADQIEFWSYESIGICIANSKGFTRIRF